jgi:hypothetical protein
MLSTIISFLFKDKYSKVKEQRQNEIYEIQAQFISRVLH